MKTVVLPKPEPAFPFEETAFDVVGLGASAGGIEALGRVLRSLPADVPAAVVVVQHLPAKHVSHLPFILIRRTRLRVRRAEDGERLESGVVYVAPPDWHVLVNTGGTLRLTQTQRVRHVRPAADVFHSMAASCGDRAVAVMLTGGDYNGATGVRAVKSAGGVVIAQDEPTAQYPSMPRAAAATGCVDLVLPLEAIGPTLALLVRTRARHRPPDGEALRPAANGTGHR